MSTLKADTVQSTGGGAVTLTAQAGAKVLFNMNLRSSTSMGIATNAISTECLNISSGVDAGTGLPRGNITNAMQNTQYIWTEGVLAANNTQNLDIGVSTASLIAFQQHDADSSSDVDAIGCSTVFGDLA
tara:strand:- start:111 stop:497 length:387 start_codon:yes stop_codon:yes gene_type:complete